MTFSSFSRSLTSSSSASASASASASESSSAKRSRLAPGSDLSTRNENPRNLARKISTKKSPFTDFGSYMVEKNRKLRDQFEVDASASCHLSGDGDGDGRGIFHGVSIFVDGFTIPSTQELRGFMLKHGGRFENYFSRHHVTHIICSHLPDSKMRNLRAFSRGLPVVKPAWVLDSVVANKLLSWVPYQLVDLVNETSKQQKLSAFFALKSISTSNDAQTLVHPKLSDEGLEEPKHLLLRVEANFSDCRAHGSEESACSGHDKNCEGSGVEPKFTDLEDEHSVVAAFDYSPHRLSNMASSDCIDNKSCKEALDTKHVGTSNKHHSTLGDPNFVENYFKNSRLHFIGTWRSRYRKRFPNIGAKCSNINVNSLSATQEASVIHIDMDCFFVSVIIRNHPELLDKPVAVCHSDNPKGTAEISSANYPARDAGVRAGMFVRDAKARCPHLVIVPYDFEAYEEVADQFYSILHKYCNKVQAMSCDEAFLDVTNCGSHDPEHLASMIRNEIAETTRCTASAGIAGNLLLARLATRSAKPNGQYFIPSEKVDNYLKDLPVEALPGIGHALGEKLKSRQIHTCGQLRMISKEALCKDFGTKIGDMLWNYCRGVDNRIVEVVQETKSVGAEVNWGVRFNDIIDCEHFLMNLCKEVSIRLEGCGVEGRTITLKVKKRRKGAREPAKFMGCGDCESMSRSMTLPVGTDNMILFQRITKQIFASFHIDVKEVRGVGLQISRLESVDLNRQGREKNALQSWLASSVKTKEQCKETTCPVNLTDGGEVLLPDGEPQPSFLDCGNQQNNGNDSPCCIDEIGSFGPSHINLYSSRSHENRTSMLPPLCHLDMEDIKSLPPEIISEVNDMYDGHLLDFMMKYDKKDGTTITKLSIRENMIGGRADFVEPYSGGRNNRKPLCSPALSISDLPVESEAWNVGHKPDRSNILKEKLSDKFNFPENTEAMEMPPCLRSNHLQIKLGTCADQSGLMPDFSKEDVPTVQPEDVKDDFCKSLPAHGARSCFGIAPSSFPREFPNSIETQNSESSKIHLWLGNPPKWVEKFKVSNCMILNVIAEFYTKPGTCARLSSILQSLHSFYPLNFDSNIEGWDEALSSLCELIKQYIDLMIESDIEELYICFRLLKRFTSMSKFFLQVYNIVLPPLQASVSENYGGELQLSMF